MESSERSTGPGGICLAYFNGRPAGTRRTTTTRENAPDRGHRYVPKVRGDSLLEDDILDGDFLVIEERTAARNGELIVVLLDSDELMLRWYFRRRGRVLLEAARGQCPAIEMPEGHMRIAGIVIGVLRQYARRSCARSRSR
jgi:SOS-response transcriptional repressor LexA